MKTSTIKLISVLATAASLLATSAAMAKGPSKGGGGNRSSSSRMSSKSKLSSNSYKLSGNNNSKNHSIRSSMSSKKGITLGQTFKKQDFSKVGNKKSIGGLGVTLGANSKFDKHSKDFFNNNSKFWFDSCYSKNYRHPFYFGCYYPSYWYFPTYSCYNYCFPRYSTFGNYSGSIAVLPNVDSPRTQVAVGSVLMVNGQAFGDKAGVARLRIGGIAMPIEVLEWTSAAVKVRLPQVEITGSSPAGIEVVRGDGSLASTTAVELTPSPEQLALGR